jgi:membrane-bound serine protease (ClpP class)
MQLTYSIGLLVLFFLLLVGEFFIPSAGLLGTAAAAAGVASIIIGFMHNVAAGFSMLVIIAVVTPVVMWAMVRYWPHTPIGRLILNRQPGQLHEPVESRTPSGERRKDLVGRIGTAKTDLLPSGLVLLDGRRLDAVSDGSPIDAGAAVVVTSAVAGKLRVRLAGPRDLEPEQTKVREQTEAIETSLESLDLESFEE